MNRKEFEGKLEECDICKEEIAVDAWTLCDDCMDKEGPEPPVRAAFAEPDGDVDKLRSALKVIHTWASFVDDNGDHPALDGDDIAKLCRDALDGIQEPEKCECDIPAPPDEVNNYVLASVEGKLEWRNLRL